MSQIQNNKIYDLETRTFDYAKKIRFFVKSFKISTVNFDDCKQLIRSSGSIAPNYIEANEALIKKDFIMRIKICRKEAKESILWTKLLNQDEKNKDQLNDLEKEATELMKIFGAILRKSTEKV